MTDCCPFWNIFSVDCVYCINGECDELEINQANGDAWCHRMIELGIEAYDENSYDERFK